MAKNFNSLQLMLVHSHVSSYVTISSTFEMHFKHVQIFDPQRAIWCNTSIKNHQYPCPPLPNKSKVVAQIQKSPLSRNNYLLFSRILIFHPHSRATWCNFWVIQNNFQTYNRNYVWFMHYGDYAIWIQFTWPVKLHLLYKELLSRQHRYGFCRHLLQNAMGPTNIMVSLSEKLHMNIHFRSKV